MKPTPEELRPVDLVASRSRAASEYLPGSLKDTLYRDYINDPDATPESLAVKHGLSTVEVALMFRQGGWVKTKQEMLLAKHEADDLVYTDLVVSQRVAVAKRKLAIGEALEDRVMATLEACKDEVLDPRALKNLAEATNAATQIRASVVGLTEKVAADSVAKAQAANPQVKASLLVIGAKPLGPAPIDVTAEVKGAEAPGTGEQ